MPAEHAAQPLSDRRLTPESIDLDRLCSSLATCGVEKSERSASPLSRNRSSGGAVSLRPSARSRRLLKEVRCDLLFRDALSCLVSASLRSGLHMKVLLKNASEDSPGELLTPFHLSEQGIKARPPAGPKAYSSVTGRLPSLSLPHLPTLPRLRSSPPLQNARHLHLPRPQPLGPRLARPGTGDQRNLPPRAGPHAEGRCPR